MKKYGCGQKMVDGNCESPHLCDVCQAKIINALELISNMPPLGYGEEMAAAMSNIASSTLEELLSPIQPDQFSVKNNRDDKSKQQKCKGVVYKANRGFTKTARGFGLFVRLNKLKRLSCPGCIECRGIEEYLHEQKNIINIENAEHNKLYTLIMTNKYINWETNLVDDYDLQLVPYGSE